MVSDILKSSGPITANNRLVHGACLATDADMYTALSEQMDPAQLGVLMNDYYARMFEPVSRHEGIISDVVGTRCWPYGLPLRAMIFTAKKSMPGEPGYHSRVGTL